MTTSAGDAFPTDDDSRTGGSSDQSRLAGPDQDTRRDSGGPLIFCGMCGALNPATAYYCAACGTTLVDAFHGSEGLRVYERPDSASRLIEIVPSGTELETVDDTSAGEDFVRVRLVSGKLGYIRTQEVDALAIQGRPRPLSTDPDINTNARGCVTPIASLGALALIVVLGILLLSIVYRSDTYDQGTMLLLFCFGLGPLLLLTTGLYLYARSRDDRLLADEEEERAARSGNDSGA